MFLKIENKHGSQHAVWIWIFVLLYCSSSYPELLCREQGSWYCPPTLIDWLGNCMIIYMDQAWSWCIHYLELFWFAFSRIGTEYGEIRSFSPYSVRIWENAEQNNFTDTFHAVAFRFLLPKVGSKIEELLGLASQVLPTYLDRIYISSIDLNSE